MRSARDRQTLLWRLFVFTISTNIGVSFTALLKPQQNRYLGMAMPKWRKIQTDMWVSSDQLGKIISTSFTKISQSGHNIRLRTEMEFNKLTILSDIWQRMYRTVGLSYRHFWTCQVRSSSVDLCFHYQLKRAYLWRVMCKMDHLVEPKHA